MLSAIPVSITDPSVRAIVKATFPAYKGRKVMVNPQDYPLDVTSYWSGGSRSYYSMIELRTLRTQAIPQNGTPFDGGALRPDGVMVPVGYAIVEHRINGSFSNQVRIHVHPESITPFLPAPASARA